jgi:hypothetical protein
MRLLSVVMAALGIPSSPAPAPPPGPLQSVRLPLAGWVEEPFEDGMRLWRDATGDVISLATTDETSARRLLDSSGVGRQRAARELAEARGAGLIEVAASAAGGPSVHLIYKRLERPAYIYTGMLFSSGEGQYLVWTVVAGEKGTTGIREAIVTGELLASGELSVDTYARSWGQDPYDPAYRGVDKSVLRSRADDERYDQRFPGHPLSKIRGILAALAGRK